MDSLASFLQMGGYAFYVWTSYAVTAAVLAGLLVATLRTLRAAERTAAILERDLPRRRRGRADGIGTGTPTGRD